MWPRIEGQQLTVDDRGVSRRNLVGDRLLVDGEVERLAHVGIGGDALVDVEDEDRVLLALHVGSTCGACSTSCGGRLVMRSYLPDFSPARRVPPSDDELVGHVGDRRRVAPVVGVGGELDRHARLAADELVRARCRSARRTGRPWSASAGATIFSQYMRAGSTPSGPSVVMSTV